MTLLYQDLVRMDLRALATWLRSEGEAANLDQEESRGLIQAFASRLLNDAENVAPYEWDIFAKSLNHAMASANLHRTEQAISQLNLMRALIEAVGPSSEYSLRSPNAAVALFLDGLPMEFDEASALAVNWPGASLEDIRRLRAIKNLLSPLVGIQSLVSDEAGKETIERWMPLLPQLP